MISCRVSVSAERAFTAGSVQDRVVSTSNRAYPSPHAPLKTSTRACKSATFSVEGAKAVGRRTNGSAALRLNTGRTARSQRPVQTFAVLASDDQAQYAEAFNKLLVSDYMTAPALTMTADTEVYAAIKTLVEKGISGLPVVDDNNRPIGVVSGFDILALDSTPGHVDRSDGMFPSVGKCAEHGGDRDKMWERHFLNAELIEKAGANKVGEIMRDPNIISATVRVLQSLSFCSGI